MPRPRVTGIASVEDYIYLAQSRQGAKKIIYRLKESSIIPVLPVIASEARQSRKAESAGWRLPRRYAPRNDD